MAVLASHDKKGKINKDKLNTNLKSISGLKYGNELLSENNLIELPAIVELDNNFYQISNDETVTLIKPQEISNLTKDNYGDYLDLGQSVVGNENSTADDWRILYNDKNNVYGGTNGSRVYAILTDYLPNSHQAVANAGFKTNEVNDIKGTYNVYSSTSCQNLLARLNHTTAWQILIPEGLISKGIAVRGATQAQILIASYNEKYNINPAKPLSTSTYFYIENNSSKGIDTLYMPHPGNSPSGCSGYWTASPCSGWPDYAWHVDYAGDTSDYGSYKTTTYGVCPVVSLPSDTKVISTTSNGNTIWTVMQ